MIRRVVLPLAAAGMLIFAIVHAMSVQQPEPKTPPPMSPPVSPFGHVVAGAGIVEASTEASAPATSILARRLPVPSRRLQ